MRSPRQDATRPLEFDMQAPGPCWYCAAPILNERLINVLALKNLSPDLPHAPYHLEPTLALGAAVLSRDSHSVLVMLRAYL